MSVPSLVPLPSNSTNPCKQRWQWMGNIYSHHTETPLKENVESLSCISIISVTFLPLAYENCSNEIFKLSKKGKDLQKEQVSHIDLQNAWLSLNCFLEYWVNWFRDCQTISIIYTVNTDYRKICFIATCDYSNSNCCSNCYRPH